jgi:hypothetical protein
MDMALAVDGLPITMDTAVDRLPTVVHRMVAEGVVA